MLLFRRHFAEIGKHTFVNPNSQLVPENMYLDDYVVIQDNTNFISLNGKLYVKKYSVISSGCIIVPSPHVLKVGVPFYLNAQYHIGDVNKDIVIEEDCWIGAGAILLPGVTIRRGTVVGAGAVVTKDTLPYSVVAGVPAKLIATKRLPRIKIAVDLIDFIFFIILIVTILLILVGAKLRCFSPYFQIIIVFSS